MLTTAIVKFVHEVGANEDTETQRSAQTLATLIDGVMSGNCASDPPLSPNGNISLFHVLPRLIE
jgi:hypothetical protein